MSHWNHRVVKKIYNEGKENEEEQYSVREAHYNDNGDLYAYTEEPVDLACESMEALKEYIQWCLNCLDKPILEDGKVVFAKDDFDDIFENLTEDELKELEEEDDGLDSFFE